jgi:hypothetical protein
MAQAGATWKKEKIRHFEKLSYLETSQLGINPVLTRGFIYERIPYLTYTLYMQKRPRTRSILSASQT